MNSPLIPADVQHAYRLIVEYLGTSFSLDSLLDFLAACRGKSVRLEEQTLPIGITGYCFAFQDVDLIVVRYRLDPVRRLGTCLHECAHFFLRHIPRTSAGEATTTFAAFVEQHVQGDVDRLRACYDEPQERAAEMLATLLIAHVDGTAHHIPETARQMYGYRSHT